MVRKHRHSSRYLASERLNYIPEQLKGTPEYRDLLTLSSVLI
ncbi:hypothetical protein [Nocardia pseudovaccinii]|nr:hypothetical protein [Nocardia pseudovaccinii]